MGGSEVIQLRLPDLCGRSPPWHEHNGRTRPRFQAVELDGDQMRLAYRHRPIPDRLYVLVFDGVRPLLLPVSKMKGKAGSRGGAAR